MANVADHYSSSAGSYHEQYQRENLLTLKDYPANYFRLQILVQRLASERLRSVYEVGVGEGTPLATMATMGFRVAGCDIAEAMVERAKDNFQMRGLSPDLIQWGDVQDSTTLVSQLAEGQFDSVIAAGVLPHVVNDGLVLDNIGMLVRPGGRVFIEFRNKLFSLFTFNRYTAEFILDDLLAHASPKIKDIVASDLKNRLAMDEPPFRAITENGSVGYDAILSKFHNPFELLELFKLHGFTEHRIHWYHYHPVPPMLEGEIGDIYRNEAIKLEHENSWRGYFLCSAGVIEAIKS